MTNNQPTYGQNMYPQQLGYQTQPVLYPVQPVPMYNQPVMLDPYQPQPYYNTPGYYQNQNQGPIIIQS
jgi:hypothetical protein